MDESDTLKDCRLTDFMCNHYSQFTKDCSVQRRGNSWRLRCRMECSDGVRRRISIAIPSEELAENIKKVIAVFRDAAKKTKDQNMHQARYIDDLKRHVDKERLQLEKELLACCPGGRGHKRSIKEMFRLAAELGKECLSEFFSLKPWKVQPRVVGRPETGIGTDKLTKSNSKTYSAIMSPKLFGKDMFTSLSREQREGKSPPTSKGNNFIEDLPVSLSA